MREMPATVDANDDATSRWEKMCKYIHEKALHAFGKKTRVNEDWYEANTDCMDPLVDNNKKSVACIQAEPKPDDPHLSLDSQTALHQRVLEQLMF